MTRRRKKHPGNPWPEKLTQSQDRLGLTNQEMADRLEISLHTYMAWKYGKRQPSPLALRAVKKHLS